MIAIEPLTSYTFPESQRGVALAIVLWFIAGMSLLAAGIVSQARVDTRMAQVHVARAKAVAAGDGAIQRMFADLVIARDSRRDAAVPMEGDYRLGDTLVNVTLVPVTGLIDINRAAPEVLFALFQQIGITDEDARLLAQNVVQSRPGGRGRHNLTEIAQLDATEDLLRMPGINRALLDVLRDFIVTGMPGLGQLEWSEAPQQVLAVLERVDGERVEAVLSKRNRVTGRAGATRLASAYRADAVLRYGGRNWLRRLWIEMSAAPGSKLPWRVVRTEPPRVLQDGNGLMGRSADAG